MFTRIYWGTGRGCSGTRSVASQVQACREQPLDEDWVQHDVIYFKANGDGDRGWPRRNMEEKAKAEDCLLSRMRHIFRLVARPLTCLFHVLRHLVAGGCDKVRAPSKLICPMPIPHSLCWQCVCHFCGCLPCVSRMGRGQRKIWSLWKIRRQGLKGSWSACLGIPEHWTAIINRHEIFVCAACLGPCWACAYGSRGCPFALLIQNHTLYSLTSYFSLVYSWIGACDSKLASGQDHVRRCAPAPSSAGCVVRGHCLGLTWH